MKDILEIHDKIFNRRMHDRILPFPLFYTCKLEILQTYMYIYNQNIHQVYQSEHTVIKRKNRIGFMMYKLKPIADKLKGIQLFLHVILNVRMKATAVCSVFDI